MKALETALASEAIGTVRDRRPVGGGSINDAWQLTLENDRVLFAKTHGAPPSGFFEAEAAGLRALSATRTIRVPQVVLVSDQALVLEWLDGARGKDYWERFGRELAALHSHSSDAFGFEQDNFCGLTPQSNPAMVDGFVFFAEARLLPQGEMARNDGKLGREDLRQLEWLCSRLDRWIPKQPPSLIHGDLWGGNAHTGPQGEPVLVDPATHYGWAEAELAMTTMFGRFPESFYRAYLANSPVEPDWEERAALYNLYHELNHLNLFGGPYAGAVRRTLKRFSG